MELLGGPCRELFETQVRALQRGLPSAVNCAILASLVLPSASHKILITRIALAVLCAVPFSLPAQQGLKLKPASSLGPQAVNPDAPIFIEADRIRGYAEKEVEAEGTVRLRRDGLEFSADWLRYDGIEEEVSAKGKVRLERDGDVIEGARLRYNIAADRGFIDEPRYLITQVPAGAPTPEGRRRAPLVARGGAARVSFEGPGRYVATEASYTTCGPDNEDWFLRARELDIDKVRDIGIARGARLVFMDRTIFYTPYISFPLQQERKSGFLTPHYGSTTATGIELTFPYYVNIAPNYDATLYPRVMSRRGLQLGGEFRYLHPSFHGDVRLEYLPEDRQADRSRYGYFFRHAHSFGPGWSGWLNVNRVSDDRYFTDLSTLVAVTSRTTLPTEAAIVRTGTWGGAGTYTLSALAQRWQTLQTDPLVPVTPPYNRQPHLALNAFRQDILSTDLDVLASYVDFRHPTLTQGRRALAYPSVSLPLHTTYGHLVPKLGVHVTRYMLDPNIHGLQDQTRVIPIFTTHSGLVFERDVALTRLPFVQTLEPALYYVYIPFRDQSRLPNFESGLLDINFATLFTENQFSGHDRINNANQVTFGVTSRLIHPQNGVERLRVALAQRFHFEPQRVTLPGIPPQAGERARSDLLAVLSGTILPRWSAEAGVQYNTDAGRTQKFNIATRYQPQPGRVLNLAYRHTAGLIGQTDLSFQWPVTPQWTVIGRWNYSLRHDRTLEALAGFEYDAGCWVLRTVAHRFVTGVDRFNTSLFVQLELNGLSRIGSNPLDVLRRNVGGYVRHDPRTAGVDAYGAER
jgi:LPS-assembly protein